MTEFARRKVLRYDTRTGGVIGITTCSNRDVADLTKSGALQASLLRHLPSRHRRLCRYS